MESTYLQALFTTAWSVQESVATGFVPWVYWGLIPSSFTYGAKMLNIYRKTNPFGKPEKLSVDFEGKTLAEVISPYTDSGNEFSYPTLVRVNEIPWLRKDWNNVVPDNSKVEVVALVGAAIPLALLIVNAIVLTATVAFTAYGIYKARKAMRALRAGRGQADADPFFSVDGHSNKANLNNPIEVAYGKNRMWPSYIGRPYRTYFDDRMAGWDNTSYVKNTNFVQIFCIGQGDFEVHAVQVGEVPLESYRGMRYEIVRPGEVSPSLARIMYIQPDFEEVTLAVNQSTDTFSMSPPGKTSNNFEIDVEFPTNGEFSFTVTLTEMNITTGALDGAVYTMYMSRPFNHAGGGTDESNPPPHRHTFAFSNGSPNSRYSLSIKNDTTSQSLKILELRSYMNPSIPVGYEDKTLLIVNYFVTSLSEDIVKDKINVIATRKIKTIQIAGASRFEIVQPSRSIPWAIYDVLTNSTYGGGLSEEFINLEALSEMDGELSRLNIYFDYVFNQATTVSDAVKVIAAAGRCSLSYDGSRLTLVRDDGNSIPEAMYSSENILPGSLSWATELFDPTDPDAIETSYIDIDSGEEHTVVFTPEDSFANNVQKVNLQGVSGRVRAWREAAYRMRKTQLVRDTFKFKTGMEGYIPSIGAVALLSSELEGMGVAGYVETYAEGWAVLSRPVTVATSGPLGRIVFRRDDGSAMGPYTITATAEEITTGSFKSVFVGNIDFDMDFWRTDKEPVHFIFNADPAITVATKVQIENAVPSDDGTIEMTVTNFDPKVYEFDNVTPYDNDSIPDPVDTILAVPWVKVDSIPHPVTSEGFPYTRIKWGACFGATYYKVYVGGIVVWTGTDTYLEWPILEGDEIEVIVSVVSGAIEGPPYIVKVTVTGDHTIANPTIREVSLNESDAITVTWYDNLGADYYEVRVLTYVSAVNPQGWYKVQGTCFKYTKAMFKNEFGDLLLSASSAVIGFDVRGVYGAFVTNISYQTITIPIAAAPASITIEQDPAVIVGPIYTRHRTIKWKEGVGSLPGTNYNIYMEIYNNGVESSTLTVRPWVKISTTDKLVFSTDLPIPQVQDANRTISVDAEYTHPVYGEGCYAYIVDADFILDPGDKLDYGLFIYDPADYTANPSFFTTGKFHPILKAGTSQIDGYVWIANATAAYLTGKRASMVYAHKDKDQIGSDWRVKGAIVADNGWFISTPPNCTTTFDIDA